MARAAPAVAVAPAMLAAVVALAAGPGCRAPHPAPVAAAVPAEGISIAVYSGQGRAYAVVDDRRTIEVAGPTILLDRIDPGAALPALLIEPLDPARGALAIERCAREHLAVAPAPAGPVAGAPAAPSGGAAVPARVTSPLVACTVTARPGRYLVRVHHVAASIGFRAQHEISMTAPDRATVSTRFAVATPAWGARAEVVLYAGAPGDGEPPRVLARGPVTLDGGTAVLALPPRDVPARLVLVYDGMTRGSIADRTDASWGKDSHHDVRAMLELSGAQLLPAPAHVRIADGDDLHELRTAYAPDEPPPAVPAARRAPSAPAPPQRLALWTARSLRGSRQRTALRGDGATIADRVELSVANLGAEPREVWLEEPLRPARRRDVVHARSARPAVEGDAARLKLVVEPGTTERVSFTIRYAF